MLWHLLTDSDIRSSEASLHVPNLQTLHPVHTAPQGTNKPGNKMAVTHHSCAHDLSFGVWSCDNSSDYTLQVQHMVLLAGPGGVAPLTGLNNSTWDRSLLPTRLASSL